MALVVARTLSLLKKGGFVSRIVKSHVSSTMPIRGFNLFHLPIARSHPLTASTTAGICSVDTSMQTIAVS